MATVIRASVSTTSSKEGVQTLAALKALTVRTDKEVRLVEDSGIQYRWDADSTATSEDFDIVRPTDVGSDASAGRWLRIFGNIQSVAGRTGVITLASSDLTDWGAATPLAFRTTTNENKITFGAADIGIANKDGTDLVFFSDAAGEILFADGGRTGNVKMAIDMDAGGVSIGNNVHSNTPPTSGLYVEGSVGVGVAPKTQLSVEGAVTIKEQAAADSDTAAYGQLWVKTATPNELYFTTDAGNDIQITTGSSIVAASGGSTAADDITAGDAAVSVATSSGAVVIDSNASTVTVDGHTGVTVTSSNSGEVDITSAANVDINATTGVTIDGTTVSIDGTDTTNLTMTANSSSAKALTIDAVNSGSGVASISLGTTSGTAISIGHSTSETTVNDNLTVTGNLTVDGTTTTINSTTLTVDDKVVVIASGAADSAAADGAGISVDGASATILYDHTGTQWEMNKPLEITGTLATTGDVTFGVDDTGVDVRMFSATASEGVLYDASEDELALLLTTKLKFHDVGGGEEIFASADGHLEVNAGTTLDMTAPTVDMNASTAVTIDGPAVTVADSAAGKPVLTLKTTHTTKTSSSELQFLKDAADTEDGEVLGQITFYGEDEGNNNTQFAGIVASISESDETDEAGKLELQVAESDGTNTAMTTGLTLEGEHATDGQIDVTIAAGAASTTTVAGDLSVTTDLTVNGDGTFHNASSNCLISLEALSGANSAIEFREGSLYWQMGHRGSNNAFYLRDALSTTGDVIQIEENAGDNLIYGKAGSLLGINTDAPTHTLTVAGTSLITGDATFGVDDTGVDVRLFSATASEGVLYDASEDELALLLTTKLKFHDVGGGEEIFASANGHLEVNAGTTLDMTAPTVDINASTTLTIDSPSVVISSSTDDKPLVEIVSTNAGANPPTLLLNHASASPADNDEIGEIVFNGNDDGGSSTMMAKIVATSPDVSNGSEDGKIAFKLRTAGAVLTPVEIVGAGLTIGSATEADSMIIFDGHAQDYRIGIDDGTDTLEIGHGTAHGTNTGLTINSSGDVTKIGQDTPSDAQVLTWDNSNTKVVWSDASGGGGAQEKAITILASGNSPLELTTSHGVILVDTSAGAYQVNLPSSDLADGQVWHIKDQDGNASANNISIALVDTTNDRIDGSTANVVINQDYGSVTLTQYEVSSGVYQYFIL